MAKYRYTGMKNAWNCGGPAGPAHPSSCPDDPDLLLLRDAAADERAAIADYLEAAAADCFRNTFLHAAHEEMQHYTMIMRLISRFDPGQARELEEHGLEFLTNGRALKACPKWDNSGPADAEDEHGHETEEEEWAGEGIAPPPDERNLSCIRHLTSALQGELLAVNKYQTYMQEARHPEVKELFCRIANDEREHIAEFTAKLFCLTGEPAAPEAD